MSDGRAHVFPQAIGFGARPLLVPRLGSVLCASALFPFRLSSGNPVRPADWYDTVAASAGAQTIPDSMAPLPGAEVLVLGRMAPVAGRGREATVRCGTLERTFRLQPDPDNPDAPVAVGPEEAAWHARDNPVGRGGSDDDRKPLILSTVDPSMPLWLGPTPFDHPLRLARAGTPDENSGAGWPRGADASVLYESHPAFWAEALDPGDALTLTGLAGPDVETRLPPYRVTVTAGHKSVRWAIEPTRIHSVMLIPSADLAAVIWRAAIPIGDDLLGESVVALIAALEDVDSPPKEAEHWAVLAVDRWNDPVEAMDDRPLLPAALAATAGAPFALADDDEIEQRRAAAEQWARDEMGVEENPFAPPEEVAGVDEAVQAEVDVDDRPPDANAVADVAAAAMAAGRRRHEEAGFETPDDDADTPREPVLRGDDLDAEIGRRLEAPFMSAQETALAQHMRSVEDDTLDADDTLVKLAKARLANSNPPLPWDAFDDAEGARFGSQIIERLAEGDVPRYLDISGATFDPAALDSDASDSAASDSAASDNDAPDSDDSTGDRPAPAGAPVPISGALRSLAAVPATPAIPATPAATPAIGRTVAAERQRVEGRHLDALLAEETTWRGTDFADCSMTEASFAGGQFENCTFTGCSFERVNLSRATLESCKFVDCTFSDLTATEPVWMDCSFDRCQLKRVTLMDAAVCDLAFSGGSWDEVQWIEALMVDTTLREMKISEITFNMTHAPRSRFEQVEMYKVWAMGKGFPGSVFTGVTARTCGFVSACHFDECRFDRTQFTEAGFANAVFKDAVIARDCRFDACDLNGAVFANTELTGVRFVGCGMTTSIWSGSRAPDAWFFAATLRNVDFADTELAGAVFTDADLEGTKMQPEKTIGTDFRGTVRASV